MHANVLLKNQQVGELLVTHRTLMHHPKWWLCSVHPHVCLQVALCGKTTSADFAFVWPFSCVNAVVHLQCTLTAENPVADDALVRICDLLLDVLHKLL